MFSTILLEKAAIISVYLYFNPQRNNYTAPGIVGDLELCLKTIRIHPSEVIYFWEPNSDVVHSKSENFLSSFLVLVSRPGTSNPKPYLQQDILTCLYGLM